MNQIQCNRCKVLVVDASDDWLLAKKKSVLSLCSHLFSIFSFSYDQYLFLQSKYCCCTWPVKLRTISPREFY